jgi:hypothetical protein
MVIRYTKESAPYQEPPSTKEEEEEIDRSLRGDLVRYMIDLRSR